MKLKNKKSKENINLDVYFAAEPEGTSIPVAFENAVRAAVLATLVYEGFAADAEVSVTFCDGPYIRELNASYREKDSETDVLSFPMFSFEDGEEPEGALGDIVISLERAREQAETFGHSFEREVAFLCVHSMLHLLGYDHELGEKEDRDMRRRQREIVERLGLGIQTEN